VSLSLRAVAAVLAVSGCGQDIDYGAVTLPPEYTEKLAETLNNRFAKLREQKSTLSIQDAAAIISLECLDELVKNKQTEQNIRTQISAYAEDASDSRAQIEKLNKELAKRDERIKQLEKEIKLRQQLSGEETADQMIKGSIDRALGGQTNVKPAQPAQQPARTAPAAQPAPARTAPVQQTRPATAPVQTQPRVTPPLSERGAAAGLPPKTNK
jgi:flagellar motility protein MotE (MotC chaperone)